MNNNVKESIEKIKRELHSEHKNEKVSNVRKYGVVYTLTRFGEAINTGDNGAALSTGDGGDSRIHAFYGISGCTGDESISYCSGYGSVAINTGNRGIAENVGETSGAAIYSGHDGVAINNARDGLAINIGLGNAIAYSTAPNGMAIATSNGSQALNVGSKGVAIASGFFPLARSQAYGGNSITIGDLGEASVGNRSGVALCLGRKSSACAELDNSIAIAWGEQCKAKGCKGAYLLLTEWSKETVLFMKESKSEISERAILSHVKLVMVDGYTIKENVWYCLKDGELIELDE